MKTFIEEYLQNPSLAVANAKESAANILWCNDIDESMIYDQLSSGEFKLYEEMIFSQNTDEHSHSGRFASL